MCRELTELVDCTGFENRRGSRLRGFESLALCHLQTNDTQPPKTRAFNQENKSQNYLYDTTSKICDTKRIYKVKNIYYYRRKIKQKLYRISLKTTNLKICLKRKKLLNLMNDKEFILYTMKLGDYQYIFEYDNIEDLKEQLEITKMTHEDILKKEKEYREVNVALNQSKTKQNDITFSILELKFLNKLKEIEEETNRKTSKESLKAYSTTFNKLKNYFKDTNIDNLSKKDFKGFRTHLKNQKLNPKTINNNIIYLNKFLNFAKNENLIEENYAKMESMLEITKIKENFTDQDYQNIFNYKFDKYYQDIFKILANTGMRISELYNIQKEDIINIDNVYCFNITSAKTENGIRQIPIHNSILNLVLKTNFPISKKSTNAFNKEVLKELYKVIDKKSTKSLHTFRANFISKLINNFPNHIEIIQEICGHSQREDKKLTIKTYGKGFNISLKNEMINSVNFLEI